jgi:hypothetical protein
MVEATDSLDAQAPCHWQAGAPWCRHKATLPSINGGLLMPSRAIFKKQQKGPYTASIPWPLHSPQDSVLALPAGASPRATLASLSPLYRADTSLPVEDHSLLLPRVFRESHLSPHDPAHGPHPHEAALEFSGDPLQGG